VLLMPEVGGLLQSGHDGDVIGDVEVIIHLYIM
jgi:hypothetical protein